MGLEELKKIRDNIKFLDSIARKDFKNDVWIDVEGVDALTFKHINTTGCVARSGTREALVAFHGTNDFVDFLLNLLLFKTSYWSGGPRGKVHSGFLANWYSVKHAAMNAVEKFDPRRELDYTCVGHSLGSVLSIFMTDELIKKGYRVKYCLTAGSPGIGDDSFNKYVGSRFEIIRLVNEYDIVPALLPFWSYRHSGVGSYLHKGNLQEDSNYRYDYFRLIKNGIKDHRIFNYVSSLEDVISGVEINNAEGA